ncbi:MAG: hypothetical protein ACJAYU_001542 [Bradymonadia bacterium]
MTLDGAGWVVTGLAWSGVYSDPLVVGRFEHGGRAQEFEVLFFQDEAGLPATAIGDPRSAAVARRVLAAAASGPDITIAQYRGSFA